MTLVEFLEARLDEDEAIARAAVGTAAFSRQTGHWVAQDVRDQYGRIPLIFAVSDKGARTQVANFEAAHEPDERRAHIARHDPARVLADVKAKIAIMEVHRHGGYNEVWDEAKDMYVDVDTCMCYEDEPCPTMRALASVYADHPDFDPAWR